MRNSCFPLVMSILDPNLWQASPQLPLLVQYWRPKDIATRVIGQKPK